MAMTRARRTLIGVGVAVLVLVLVLLGLSRRVCLEEIWRHRLVLPQCQDGELRQTLSVSASGLHRGGPGGVTVGATAHYTTADSESHLAAPVASFRATLALVDAAGKETPLAVGKEGWIDTGDEQAATVVLP